MDPVAWKVYITTVTMAVFMVPALIIAICYTIMVHTIWNKSRILTPEDCKRTLQEQQQPPTSACKLNLLVFSLRQK